MHIIKEIDKTINMLKGKDMIQPKTETYEFRKMAEEILFRDEWRGRVLGEGQIHHLLLISIEQALRNAHNRAVDRCSEIASSCGRLNGSDHKDVCCGMFISDAIRCLRKE